MAEVRRASAPVNAQQARKPIVADSAKAQARDPYPTSDDPGSLAGFVRDKYDANKYKTEYRMVWDPEDEEYEYQPVTITIPRDGELDQKEFNSPYFGKLDALLDQNGKISINELNAAFQKMDPALRQNILTVSNEARRKVEEAKQANPRGKEGWLSFGGLGGATALGIGAGLAAATLPALAIGLGVAAAGAAAFGIFNLVKVIGKSNRIGKVETEGRRRVDEAFNRGFASV